MTLIELLNKIEELTIEYDLSDSTPVEVYDVNSHSTHEAVDVEVSVDKVTFNPTCISINFSK